jgi:hypothetical protein
MNDKRIAKRIAELRQTMEHGNMCDVPGTLREVVDILALIAGVSEAPSVAHPISDDSARAILLQDAHRVAARDNLPVASILIDMVMQLRAELLSAPDAVAALGRVRKALYDIPLSDGFASGTRDRYPIQIVDDAAKAIDAEIASITDPTRPTKPLITVVVNGDVNAESLAKLEAYIKTTITGDA